MTLITFDGGKVVLQDGKVGIGEACCCDPCVPCSCGKCVTFSFVERGDKTLDPPPDDQTVLYDARTRSTSCPEKESCHDFEYEPDPFIGQLGASCSIGELTLACRSRADELAYVFYVSEGGKPCARVRCSATGEYFLDICVFNTCYGGDAAVAGRLTRKTYELTLGDDGCPSSVGEEVSSSVTDWARNFLTGQWIPASDYGWDLDGNVNETPLCNQDCWSEWPSDFEVCEVIAGVCDCNAFP